MAEKTVKPANYTAEQTAELVFRYVDEKHSIESLAAEFGKSTRSIIAKLSREKVYIAKAYVSKTGEKPVKKDTVADAIGLVLKLTEPEIESLTKANKTALAKIFAALANSKPIEN